MPPNFTRALRKGAVSSGTFVLAPFLTICFFFYKLHRISTRLGQNHQSVKGYKSYQQFDFKGQIGVTGVKNVKTIFFYGKCYSSYMLHSRVTWLRYINKLETLYKTYWLKSRSWVIWGHRGQKFIFTKMLLLIQYTLYGHVTYAYKQAWDPLQNSLTQISIWGHLGSYGQKVISTKSDITRPCYIAWLQDSCICISLRPSTCVVGQGSTRCHPKS